MLALRRNRWPLFAVFISSSLILGVYQTVLANSTSHQSQAPIANVAVSRREQSQTLFTAGIQKALQGDYKNAIQDYDQALKLAPSNSEVYYNRGVAYFSIGLPQNAIQDFDQAITLQPSMAEAYGNRGMIRSHLGDRPGALADYQKAMDLFQQQGDASAAQQMQDWIKQQDGTSPS